LQKVAALRQIVYKSFIDCVLSNRAVPSQNVVAILLGDFHAKDKLISAVCHGPTPLALVKVAGTNDYLLAGHQMTGLSHAEVGQLSSTVPVPFIWMMD
jgi:hypothetical protein